jgi:tRNA nucleotidyltransferase (CCA-adding enzyme)
MSNTLIINDAIMRMLSAAARHFLKTAAKEAAARGQELYAIGGIVRDGLMSRPANDLDLSTDRDAIDLAKKLAGLTAGKLTRHPRFGTATITCDDFHADIATLRRETYEKPGALPVVAPGSLKDDLNRRDFTVNAMACRFAPEPAGELVDPCHGQADIAARLIRVLHSGSFRDDPTRVWRALRYEQRLGFRLEDATEKWLRRDAPRLADISGERLRYEIECVCREDRPEDIFRRAAALGVLDTLPGLNIDDETRLRFETARTLYLPKKPPAAVYLSLLTFNMNIEALDGFIVRLRLPRKAALVLRQTNGLMLKLPGLKEDAKPSAVTTLLQDTDVNALRVALAAAGSRSVKRQIGDYLDKYRHVRPLLNGDDLLAMGIAPGPALRETLRRLRSARLDGLSRTKQDEMALVAGYTSKTP